jgi:uncharacterized protein with FMN-binding domain
MKRAVLVGVGTLAGVAALVVLNPEAGSAGSGSTAVASGSTSSGASSSGASSSGTSSSSTGTSSGAVKDGTYTGDAVDVGRGYGTMQVEVTVTGGRVVDVTALAVPQNDPRSSQISSEAVPMLVQQAIAAQSASIAGLSGATYTSNGFAQSLRSALVHAGLAA